MNRDDSHDERDGNGAPSASRRQWLQGALALTVAGLTGSLALRALADSANSAASATAGALSNAPASLDAFMTLSQALTGKTGLDRDIAERLFAALQKSTPDLAQRVPQLAGAFAAGTSNEADQALALKILEGWYVGLVDNAVVTYEGALMYQVVSDTLIVRSYCPNKPGFWAAKPVEKQS